MTVCTMIACAALQAATAAEAAATNSTSPPAVAERPLAAECEPASATNEPPVLPPVKIVYGDVPSEDFCVEYWAEELAESAAEGLHARNGYVLAVVRMPSNEDEEPMLTKLRAKFRAVEVLRFHFPKRPAAFSAPCRVLVCERSGDPPGSVCVVSFKATDLPNTQIFQSLDSATNASNQ